MNRRAIVISLALLIVTIPKLSFAQQQSILIDENPFIELSLNAISSVGAPDRRAARTMLSHQIELLSVNTRTIANNQLLAIFRLNDPKTRNDVLGVLTAMPHSWATTNVDADSQAIYNALLETSDDTDKGFLDSALANAKGLYQDGIRDFNSTVLADVVRAQPKLKAMSVKFPKSRYAERANYYLGHSYTKRYLLNDPAGRSLIDASNAAFEEYITRAERGEFDNRKEYLAAGYYYRALNAWLANDVAGAQTWLARGQQKFSDTDRVYIYQLFVSRDRNAVIDRPFAAKSLFAATANFLNKTPPPTYDNANELIALLQKS